MNKTAKIGLVVGAGAVAYWLYQKFGPLLNIVPTIQGTQLKLVGFPPTPTVITQLRIDNKGSKPVQIDKVWGDITVNGVWIGQLQSQSGVNIPPGSYQYIPLQTGINLGSVGLNFQDLAKSIVSGGLKLKFDGYVSANGMTLPYSKQINVLDYAG